MPSRYLLPSLILTLASFSLVAHEHEHEHEHEHSLAAHVHGVATLNIAIENQQLALQLASPAMNIIGFEYKPHSAADQHAVITAERSLKNEQLLFVLPQSAGCSLSALDIDNDLTDLNHEEQHSTDATQHQHSDIIVNYSYKCTNPVKLRSMELTGFFKAFPLTEKINVQLISAQAQQGSELTANNPLLSW